MSINLSHLKKLIATMIPILIAQVSTVGMNFMDSTMSGHVSANDLAGVSIGASLFLPIQTTAMGLLTAASKGFPLPPQFPPSPRTTCSHLWAHSFLKCSRCRCAH